MEPLPGVPSDNTTMVSELQRLREAGYAEDCFADEGPAIVCHSCGHRTHPAETELDALRRLEGASEPDEMTAILAITCPACGEQGTAVVAYGPSATEVEDAVLRALPDGMVAQPRSPRP